MQDLKNKIYQKLQMPQLVSFATMTKEGKPWVRYVMAWATPDLDIMLSTSLSSRKVEQVKANPDVHFTAGAMNMEDVESYLQIEGKAEVSQDAELLQRVWNDNLKRYFTGPDDPNFCIVITKPTRIEWYSMTEMTPLVWEA